MISIITVITTWLFVNLGISTNNPNDSQIQQYEQETGLEWVGEDGGAGRS